MTKQEMVSNLKALGLENAIADTNASIDGTPAILIRWNGKEEYYTGQDIYEPGTDPFDPTREQYQNWLVKNFS